jgi:hypothetical protein
MEEKQSRQVMANWSPTKIGKRQAEEGTSLVSAAFWLFVFGLLAV